MYLSPHHSHLSHRQHWALVPAFLFAASCAGFQPNPSAVDLQEVASVRLAVQPRPPNGILPPVGSVVRLLPGISCHYSKGRDGTAECEETPPTPWPDAHCFTVQTSILSLLSDVRRNFDRWFSIEHPNLAKETANSPPQPLSPERLLAGAPISPGKSLRMKLEFPKAPYHRRSPIESCTNVSNTVCSSYSGRCITESFPQCKTIGYSLLPVDSGVVSQEVVAGASNQIEAMEEVRVLNLYAGRDGGPASRANPMFAAAVASALRADWAGAASAFTAIFNHLSGTKAAPFDQVAAGMDLAVTLVMSGRWKEAAAMVTWLAGARIEKGSENISIGSGGGAQHTLDLLRDLLRGLGARMYVALPSKCEDYVRDPTAPGVASWASQACSRADASNAWVCGLAGSAFMYAGDRARADEAHRRACMLGHAHSCPRSNTDGASEDGHLDNPQLLPEDRARFLLGRACDGGSGENCRRLGDIVALGKPSPKEDKEARALYERSCDLGYHPGCTSVGTYFEQGRGGSQDTGRAREVYRKACDLGSAEGCQNLGAIFYRGTGSSRDPAQAAQFYGLACERKPGESCNSAGWIHFGLGNDADAAKFYKLGCDGRDGMACFNLGLFYWKAKKDGRRAFDNLTASCTIGYAPGCVGAKLVDLANQGAGSAYALTETAKSAAGRLCLDEHQGEACALLGLLTSPLPRNGQEVPYRGLRSEGRQGRVPDGGLAHTAIPAQRAHSSRPLEPDGRKHEVRDA